MKNRTGALLLILALSAGAACERHDREEVSAKQVAPAPQERNPEALQADAATRLNAPRQVSLGGAAVCEPSANVGAALERLATLADADGNGRVSREEASAVTNFVIGGAFFRADANSDGTVTPEEGRALRAELLDRNPGFQALLLSGQAGDATLAKLAEWTHVDYTKAVTVAEARETGRAVVDHLFRVADANEDDAIDQSEAKSAAVAGARGVARAAFDEADRDQNGALSKDEARALIEVPVDRAFELSDDDGDGALNEDEAARALERLSRWVGIPTVGAPQQSRATPPEPSKAKEAS